MAKAKLPLLGIKASGQLGKSIVYFNWKGVNAVRSHVVPSNPNTTDQQDVRNDFTDQVDAWHHADMLKADKDAWNLLAGVTKRAASGFNEFVSYFRKNYGGGGDVSHIRSVVVSANTGGSITVTAKSDSVSSNVPNLMYGSSKTYMPTAVPAGATWTQGACSFTVSGLTPGETIYFQIVDEDLQTGPPPYLDPYGRSGIFKLLILP